MKLIRKTFPGSAALFTIILATGCAQLPGTKKISPAVQGYITSAITSEPIPRAKVTLQRFDIRKRTRTNDEGYYFINPLDSWPRPDVRDAKIEVIAEAKGYLKRSRAVFYLDTTLRDDIGDETRSINIELEPFSGNLENSGIVRATNFPDL